MLDCSRSISVDGGKTWHSLNPDRPSVLHLAKDGEKIIPLVAIIDKNDYEQFHGVDYTFWKKYLDKLQNPPS